MPVTMPKLVTMGAEHSCRRRTMTWQGTATSNSKTLPRSSQETIRSTTVEELRKKR